MTYTRAWYADRVGPGAWRFAPSKFVGYTYPSADDYIADSGASGDRDGRQTENLLGQWYSVVDPATALGRELLDGLRGYLAGLGQRPNAAARINVLKTELDRTSTRAPDADLLKRISVDPLICGGRPCIRGTRMRVSDVVGMMAQGATTAEILADYDYLTQDDLSAALAYAAEAANHRVIRAA